MYLPKRSFNAYIFDCDGTLADTMGLHYQAWKIALKPYGAELPEDLYYSWGGRPAQQIVESLNQMHGVLLTPELILPVKEELYNSILTQVKPIEPLVSIVRSNYGKKPMAVVSGGVRRSVHATLGILGLLHFFDTIVTAEDYKNGKPEPDPYLEAAARLGIVPSECLVFEDTEVGRQSANAAGMECVLVEDIN